MNLIIVGFGYVSYYVYQLMSSDHNLHNIWATTRNPGNSTNNIIFGEKLLTLNDTHTLAPDILAAATHILITTPPNEGSDTFLHAHGNDLAHLRQLKWVGYISSTSVYGDHKGKWVDEETPCNPTSQTGRDRLSVENAYRRLFDTTGVPIHIFRSSGIYGSNRSVFDRLNNPKFHVIYAPEHLFSRIHVTDMARLLYASMAHPTPGETFTLADNQPASQYEVVHFACGLLGRSPPPLIARSDTRLSPREADFYRDNKRVRSDKIRNVLRSELMYPTYKEGLTDIYRRS